MRSVRTIMRSNGDLFADWCSCVKVTFAAAVPLDARGCWRIGGLVWHQDLWRESAGSGRVEERFVEGHGAIGAWYCQPGVVPCGGR
jgi:hypothetical protein